MSTQHVPLHIHSLLSLCFMCNSIIYERRVLSMYHSTHKHITYYQCALCATGLLYERQVLSMYHSAHKHNLLSLCFVCNRLTLWKTSIEHVPLHTQPIITVLYVQQYHFMKDKCWARTTPHTHNLVHCFVCNRTTLWKRSTEHVPLLRFGECGVSQRVVGVILKGNTSCRVPLGVLLGKTFPGKGPDLQLLPFAQFADENVWWAEQKLVVKKSSDVDDKASAFSKDWPDKALTSSNNTFL